MKPKYPSKMQQPKGPAPTERRVDISVKGRNFQCRVEQYAILTKLLQEDFNVSNSILIFSASATVLLLKARDKEYPEFSTTYTKNILPESYEFNVHTEGEYIVVELLVDFSIEE